MKMNCPHCGCGRLLDQLQHKLEDWKERALNAELRLQVYSSRSMTQGEKAELEWNKSENVKLKASLASIATHFPDHAAGHMAEEALGSPASGGAAE